MERSEFTRIDLLGFALLIVVMIVYGCLSRWFFHRLRRYDPATYEWLGSPSLLWNKPQLKTFRFLRFLSSPQWKQLPDPTLVKICFAIRMLLYIYAILLPSLVVLVMRSALL
jgi:hypothetical protein